MRMEVIKLMSHLLITLVLVIGYIVLVFVKGVADETLKGAIFAIIGYWFGAVGIAAGKTKSEETPKGTDTHV